MLVRGGPALLLLVVLLAPAVAAEPGDAGVRIEIRLAADEIQAGDTLVAGVLVRNPTDRDHFVVVEGFLAPPAEPIAVPPVSSWERFVWLLLSKLTGDCDVIQVPSGETRAVRLDLPVHPRMHGRFDAVAVASTVKGTAQDRASFVSKITAPPSSVGVLVHGQLYELGPYRLLVTDDGHVYEPKDHAADVMFELLQDLYPAPDGVTVLGGILPNTLGGIGVELGVDLFRFDRDPGSPTGLRWRTLARGSSPRPCDGPEEEIVRSTSRLKEVLDALGADPVGPWPRFRREMVAVVRTAGTSRTRIRVTRAVVRDGVLTVHYLVTMAGPGLASAETFGQPYHLVALPRFDGEIRFVRHDFAVRGDAYRTGVLEIETPLDLAGAREDARRLEKALADPARAVEKR